MRQKYIDECKQIQQNALYSAETHHTLSSFYNIVSFFSQAVPAATAAISSGLVTAGKSPSGWLLLTVVSASIAAIANILNPKTYQQDHLNAAKNFTIIKNNARAMHEAFSSRLSDDALAVAVENLHNRYNDLVRVVPPTTNWAFWFARKRIQKNLHTPDRDQNGDII
jgi:hypothetical protein